MLRIPAAWTRQTEDEWSGQVFQRPPQLFHTASTQTGCLARDAERSECVNHFHLQRGFNKLERVTYIVDKYFEEARIRDDFYL